MGEKGVAKREKLGEAKSLAMLPNWVHFNGCNYGHVSRCTQKHLRTERSGSSTRRVNTKMTADKFMRRTTEHGFGQ